MSSKSSKKKKKNSWQRKLVGSWNKGLSKARNFTPEQQAMINELNAAPTAESDIMRVFTKWRFITYFCVVFLPPYGLYRVWSKDSTFRYHEQLIWTFMILMYMGALVKMLLFP